MPYGWTVEQIREAIDRCERDAAEMVARHAKPEEIAHRRHGLDAMRSWLEKAESKADRK